MKSIYDEAIEIIESRTKIGTMSRDYGHTVDDVLHVENAYELTTLDKALERAKKVEELLDLYRLQQEFKERYNTQVRVLDRQETLDTLREIAEEIYLKEKELEEMK